KEESRGLISARMQDVRKEGGAPGQTPVVISHSDSGGQEYRRNRDADRDYAGPERRSGRVADKPPDKPRSDRNTEKETLIRATVCKNSDTHSQQHTIAHSRATSYTRKRARTTAPAAAATAPPQ